VARLLDYAQSQRENFFVSGVGHSDNKIIDLTIRRSSKLKNLGDLKDELRQRARVALPAMCEQLGTAPFEPSKFELELVAHGDGPFYTRHRDTNFRNSAPVNGRVISAVYYFHRIPKSFSGGALRIY
jgi:SM-20-related protein